MSFCLVGSRAGQDGLEVVPGWRVVGPGIRLPDGLVVLFEGRIFERTAAAREAGCAADASDASIVGGLYRRHGAGLMDVLRGYFALAIVDPDGPRVFAAHDRCDMERIFFGRTGADGEVVVIGNALPEVLRVVGAAIDPAVLPEVFGFGQLSGTETIFRNVCRLRTGETLECVGGTCRVDREAYLRLVGAAADEGLTEAAALERLEAALGAALARAVEGDPINTLSGGADSSYLQCLLLRSGHRRSWSVAVEGTEAHHDHAREVAGVLGTEHRTLTVSGDQLLDAMHEGIRLTCMPGTYVGEAVSLALYAHLGGEGGGPACVVGGDHADKVLADGLPLLMLRLYGTVPGALVDLAVAWSPFGRRHPRYRGLSRAIARDTVDVDLMTRFAGDPEREAHLRALLGPDAVQRSYAGHLRVGSEVAGPLEHRVWAVRLLTSDERCRALWIKNQLAKANGIALVEPFADPDVIRAVWTIPNRLKLRRLTEKYLEKRLLLRELPRRIVLRKKVSNAMPFHALERTSPKFRRLLAAMGEHEWPEVPGFRRHAAWAIERARRQDAIDWDLVFLMNLHLWYRQQIQGERIVL